MKFPDNIVAYGDKDFRGDCPKEDAELITFFNVLKRRCPALAAVALHIKNEGKRSYMQAQQERAKGALKTGACDIVIPVGVRSFICELKRRDHTKSKIDAAQVNYLTAAQDLGSFCCIAMGYEAALEALLDWIKSAGIEVEYQLEMDI